MSESADDTPNNAFVWSGQTIRDALSLIDGTTVGGIVFLDDESHVLGFVSDGDIRRALIQGKELTDPVAEVWTAKPLSISSRSPIATRYQLLKERNIRHLILLGEAGQFDGFQTRNEVESLFDINPRRCPVLLMAGGRGQRLMPLTSDCPKPMLELAGQPLLEHTLTKLIGQGFESFYISVNYLKDRIIDYFGDGSRFNVEINYLEEESATGTGGCLHLLPQLEERYLLMMNGDIITDLDFRGLVSFHDSQDFAATMVVREQESKIDYGVVRVDGPRFLRLDEKPKQTYFINTGIYALSTAALNHMPESAYFDMPDLFANLVTHNQHCGVFEHTGQWIDIGTPTQLQAARNDRETGASLSGKAS